MNNKLFYQIQHDINTNPNFNNIEMSGIHKAIYHVLSSKYGFSVLARIHPIDNKPDEIKKLTDQFTCISLLCRLVNDAITGQTIPIYHIGNSYPYTGIGDNKNTNGKPHVCLLILTPDTRNKFTPLIRPLNLFNATEMNDIELNNITNDINNAINNGIGNTVCSLCSNIHPPSYNCQAPLMSAPIITPPTTVDPNIATLQNEIQQLKVKLDDTNDGIVLMFNTLMAKFGITTP